VTLSRTSRRAVAAAFRTGLALGAAGALTLLGTGVAAAHVTAQPDTAAKGSYAVVAFRVPSELATAGTVKLVVTLPADHPIVSARTEPMAGWKAEVTNETLPAPVDTNGSKITEAVRTITWTAQPGTRLAPTEFADFKVSLGRLPDDVDELVMPAVQTYDDGTVVAWDQPTPPGGEEPEHPAPTLHLVAAEEGDTGGHDHGAMAGMGGHQHGQAAGAVATDRTARWLGGAGLLVGALGLGVGIGAIARLRRSRT
jgi:uncharacterized protein YcnI